MEPPVEGVETCPLAEILKDVPGKFADYVQNMAKSVSEQLLSFVKSSYPQADLDPIMEGIAEDCSDELFSAVLVGDGPDCRRSSQSFGP